MKSIAIITARGGSKRIPQKNIRPFCGKPILAYSVEAALQSGIFDEVMVSTDSEEIAAVARAYGAHVPFLRSAVTSNDYATTNDVLAEVLEQYAERGMHFASMCCLYPTAPFVTAQKLRQAAQLMAEGAQSVMPVVAYSFPPQRGLVMKAGKLEYQYPAYQLARSQDLEPVYHDCGQFYFYRLGADNSFVDGNYTGIILPETEVQDIDNLSDWEIAELKYQHMMAKAED